MVCLDLVGAFAKVFLEGPLRGEGILSSDALSLRFPRSGTKVVKDTT